MKKFLIGSGAAIATAFGLVSVAGAQVSSSTLGTTIDTLNATVSDYLTILIQHYWPFVVGFVILVAVWGFGRRILGHFR